MSRPRQGDVITTLQERGAEVTQLSLDRARHPPPPEGELLGRYPLLGKLGAGGMGAVLQVRDADLGRDLAAKVITGEGGERIERFVREAQITGQLEHPNIIPLHELGLTPEGRVYFTMKQVKGSDLRQVLWEADESGEDRLVPLLEILLKVCDAVGFAHSRGVIHRDLKPANVMVGEFGEVLVMDWGLSTMRNAECGMRNRELQSDDPLETQAGTVMGTPAYMPPEQAEGRIEALDPRSDIYSLGAMLYEMLTFEPPFDGPSASFVLELVKQGRLVPPSQRDTRRAVPWELELVVLKAMAHRQAERYASVAELKAEITRFLQGGTLQAASYTPLQLLGKWARRHRTPLAAAAVAGVLALSTGIWAMQAYQHAAQRREVEALLRRVEQQLAGRPLEAERSAVQALALAPGDDRVQQALRRATLAAEARRREAGRARRIAEQRKGLETARAAAARVQQAGREWYRARRAHLNAARGLHRLLPEDGAVRRELVGAALALADRLCADASWEMAHQMIEEAAVAGLAPDEVARRRRLVETLRQARVKQEVDQARAILDQMKQSAPPAGMFEEYVTRLVKLPRPHVVKLLIPALFAEQERVRVLAMQALGGIGDCSTRAELPVRWFPEELPLRAVRDEFKREDLQRLYGELRRRCIGGRTGWAPLDAVQALSLRLAASDLFAGAEETVQLIWALGRLRDPRAFAVVALKRFAEGPRTRLWQRTRLPFGWLPEPVHDGRPETAVECDDRGILAMNQGRLRAALALFNRAHSLAPRLTSVLNNRGFCRHALGDLEGARRDFDRALALDPRLHQPLLNRGRLSAARGDLERALADFSRAIALSPGWSLAYNNRGTVWTRKGELDRALADFDKAIELNPNNVNAITNRARCYMIRAEYGRALEEFDRGVALDPSSSDLRASRGYVRFQQGDLAGAIEDATSAIALDARDARSYRIRGLAWQKRRELDRAQADFDQALELAPRDPLCHAFRAGLFIERKQYDRARADLARGLQLDPRCAWLYRLRAQLHTLERRLPAALADLDRGLEYDPFNLELRFERAQLRQAASNLAGALADLEQVCKRAPSSTGLHGEARRLMQALRALQALQGK